MKKLLLLLFTFVFVAGCNGSIVGILKLSSDVTLDFHKKGEHDLEPGNYEVKIKQNVNDGYINVEFQNLWGSKDPDVRFYYDGSLNVPKENGEFNIPADETGQNLGLDGRVATTYAEGERVRERESCTWRERRHVCYRGRRGQRVCRIEHRDRRGWRTVEYIPVLRRRHIEVQLVDEGSVVGQFDYRRNERLRDYIYEGRCF